jgi:minor extracellular serine protease Vpr
LCSHFLSRPHPGNPIRKEESESQENPCLVYLSELKTFNFLINKIQIILFLWRKPEMKYIFNILLICALLGSLAPAALAQTSGPERSLPAHISDLKLESPIEAEGASPRLDTSLVGAQGPRQVVVRLSTMSVGELFASPDLTLDKSPKAQKAQLKAVAAQQTRLISAAKALDPNGKVLGTTQRVRNLLLLEIDTAKLAQLALNPEVLSIRPVVDYEMDLANAVPYVGASAVQASGFTGAGVKVAIIDSGIDYTHAFLGGSGLVADYVANDPNVIEPGSFPTTKVIGGTDYVGGTWPSGPLAPDPDPLDKGPSAGHGTHVSSITAGTTGMAPGASLYALKVCSSVSTSCSGVAMLQALDWITDPNGDGDMSDHADVANMSIGSPYGQPFDDDTSAATEMAVSAGVLVVTSTGNSADKPYIGGTPGATMSALSVAATENPSSALQLISIVSPASIAGNIGGAWQPWSAPLTSVIEAPVGYFATPTAKRIGCSDAAGTNPYAPGDFAGQIALIDRGTCAISAKVQNAQSAGAVAVIVGLVAAGDPTVFAFGGGAYPTIPAYNITQASANRIKGQIAAGVIIRLDPAIQEPLAGTVAGFSSRGPSTLNYLKPEIAAPGDMVAAKAGGGTATVQMAGTSMASPMVAGAGALLKQAKPYLNARQLKAALVENAETNVMNKAPSLGGRLAPITRIGGGELRIDRAVNTKAVALEVNTLQPVLSYGLTDIIKEGTLIRSFKIYNLTNKRLTYNITSTFRFPEDQASGAVEIKVSPNKVNIAPFGQSATITVQMKIYPTRLAGWSLNSGAAGASGDVLTANEFDGYIWMDDTSTTADNATMLHMPWFVLPRLAGKVGLSDKQVAPNGTVGVMNDSAGPAYVDTYSLLAVSENLPESPYGMNMAIVDLKYVGVQTYPVPAGYCSAAPSFILAVQLTTWERQAHANAPAEFDVYFDTNRDGNPDYAAYTFDVSNSTTFDGRNATHVVDLAAGVRRAWFLTDHSTNSTNTTMVLCGEQIGLTAANFGQMMDVSVYAFDWYNSGALTDYVEGLTFAPLGERYAALFGNGDAFSTDLAPYYNTTLTAYDFGAAGTNPNELGLLLVNTAFRGSVSSGAPINYEASALLVKP